MTGRTDRWIQRTTIGCVGMLAMIAGTVSYLHMHLLVQLHGEPGWVAALTPLSVDGMIVAASTTLLAESRSGGRGGLLPWGLLAAGSVASLAANASKESTITAVIRVAEGHVIWSDLLECLLDSGNSESIVLDLHPGRSTPIDVPDIIFDQDQYLAEVQRAITDREWESERWRTAQLLDEYLSPGHPWSIGEELLPGIR